MIALKTGHNPPRRYQILLAAAEWGKAPWEVEDGPAHWFMYWQQVTSTRAQLANAQTWPDEEEGDTWRT